jgi:hypothetical protein
VIIVTEGGCRPATCPACPAPPRIEGVDGAHGAHPDRRSHRWIALSAGTADTCWHSHTWAARRCPLMTVTCWMSCPSTCSTFTRRNSRTARDLRVARLCCGQPTMTLAGASTISSVRTTPESGSGSRLHQASPPRTVTPRSGAPREDCPRAESVATVDSGKPSVESSGRDPAVDPASPHRLPLPLPRT